MKNKAITIDEAENYIFNPYTVNKIEKEGGLDELAFLYSLGCELEDVLSLIPDMLENNFNDLIEKTLDQLNKLKGLDSPKDKWYE
ncbi:protein of unknown function DUF3969 [Gottschalkia purinilytica]|uniref:Uncharacterized protein n=1 Tax=Gottschalkia purinilytica TaxID=1503 RepID=A0A0L0W9F6_GOTPU|nr:protein of unknown function DUF3969 [Gottschalkia purinilytica]